MIAVEAKALNLVQSKTLLYVGVSYLLMAHLLIGCALIPSNQKLSKGHVTPESESALDNSIPQHVQIAPQLPQPKPYVKTQKHTVVVHEVPVKELLFSLARDAKLNLDIYDNVDSLVTINAIKQPLTAILERISEKSDLRYEIKNDVLIVRKDTPFLRNYRVDYLNMSRSSKSSISVSTLIDSTGKGAGNETTGGSSINNNSQTSVENVSNHSFWETLHKNIASIVNSTQESKASAGSADTKAKSSDASFDHPDILLNRESGVIGVRATKNQHKEIQGFLDEVLASTRRQVLIEATIAEVKLSDSFQAGIDWQAVTSGINPVRLSQNVSNIELFSRPNFTATFSDNSSNGSQLRATLSALETFGEVSIMSSPKVMVLNNQTALLKVVDNLIYFELEVNIDRQAQTGDLITYNTEINSVPVGFVMSVTPFVSEHGSVTLNIRPTISRVLGFEEDPNPALAEVNVVSRIPIIQVREVESILKVSDGDVAIIGGLMQDEIDKNSEGLPFISKIPLLGSVFSYKSDTKEKTELVIFIKPKVISHASLTEDLKQYSRFLPSKHGE